MARGEAIQQRERVQELQGSCAGILCRDPAQGSCVGILYRDLAWGGPWRHGQPPLSLQSVSCWEDYELQSLSAKTLLDERLLEDGLLARTPTHGQRRT